MCPGHGDVVRGDRNTGQKKTERFDFCSRTSSGVIWWQKKKKTNLSSPRGGIGWENVLRKPSIPYGQGGAGKVRFCRGNTVAGRARRRTMWWPPPACGQSRAKCSRRDFAVVGAGRVTGTQQSITVGPTARTRGRDGQNAAVTAAAPAWQMDYRPPRCLFIIYIRNRRRESWILFLVCRRANTRRGLPRPFAAPRQTSPGKASRRRARVSCIPRRFNLTIPLVDRDLCTRTPTFVCLL